MTKEEYSELSDSEMLRRIYAAQLRMMVEIEQIQRNVAALRMKDEPEKRDEIAHWEHLSEVHKKFNDAYAITPGNVEEATRR